MNDSPAVDRRQIKTFVRDSLGCTCPDSVFDDIRIADDSAPLPSACSVYAIGERLFVGILCPADWHAIEPSLGRLVDSAMHYRDQHGFHRFRLVIAVRDERAAIELGAAFGALPGKDDRVHLHVIAPEQLPFNVVT